MLVFIFPAATEGVDENSYDYIDDWLEYAQSKPIPIEELDRFISSKAAVIQRHFDVRFGHAK